MSWVESSPSESHFMQETPFLEVLAIVFASSFCHGMRT
ncbi:hypothetical protein SynROS8604_01640 [Synechococcus sp. ROS8604]|nr:hypothetical protein SynROS8604_01640 [Synechococcus sp. ROS8604]